MKKIIDYGVVVSNNHRSLVDKVQELMKTRPGWEPIGGISVAQLMVNEYYDKPDMQYVQAVARYEE